MIRRTLRFVIRLGLFAGIGLALFKVLQGRRSASEFGSPSPDWAPPPSPNPNLPKSPPEPELIKPAMLEEVIEKKAAVRAALPDDTPAPPAGSQARAEQAPAAAEAPVKKASAPKKVAPKKAAAAAPAAAGPVKKVVPPKKAAPTKAASKRVAPPADAPVAKKAAPVKKAPKKSQPGG